MGHFILSLRLSLLMTWGSITSVLSRALSVYQQHPVPFGWHVATPIRQRPVPFGWHFAPSTTLRARGTFFCWHCPDPLPLLASWRCPVPFGWHFAPSTTLRASGTFFCWHYQAPLPLLASWRCPVTSDWHVALLAPAETTVVACGCILEYNHWCKMCPLGT